MSESTADLRAEWAPQVGVMLTWPQEEGEGLAAIEAVFVRIAVEVAQREAVLICCRDAVLGRRVRGLLRAAGVDLARVHLHAVASADIWAREHGPITVVRSGWPQLLDFRSAVDDEVCGRLHALGAFDAAPMSRVDVALTGGCLETDGAGTLLIARSRLRAAAADSGVGEAGLCERLAALFGLERVMPLDIDGPVDGAVRFVDTTTIVYQQCDDPADPRWASLQALAASLAGLRTGAGAPYRLVALPWPRARLSAAGERLPLSYASFLIINNAVLVPTYDDLADAEALVRLTQCFPGRDVVGIDCLSVVERRGGLHGLTMHLPLPLTLGPDTA